MSNSNLVLVAVLLTGALTGPLASSPASAAAWPSCIVEDATLAVARSHSLAVSQWGGAIEYRAFDGSDHVLTVFPGVHVEVLLPPSWNALLTDEEIRRLVARADLLYFTFRELTESEPWGFGRLQIAMVHTAGASGRGRLGFKGVEIEPLMLDSFQAALRHDSVPWLLSHELGHNFDRQSNLFRLGSDAPHAWTELVQHLALAYEKSGAVGPRDVIEDALANFVLVPQWLAEPDFSFEHCTTPSSTCGDTRLNAMFGMMGLRTLQLHGLDRAPQLLRFLTRIQERFGLPADRWEAADIYIEGLAEAAQQDVSCYVDAWKWHASPALRQRLAATWGANPLCADSDGDGVTPFQGDTDDSDATVHPLAPELPDGRDNDGNGIIDDAYFAAGVDAGFGADFDVPIPALLDGAFAAAGKTDTFRFTLETAGRVILTVARRSPLQGRLELFAFAGGNLSPISSTTLDWYGTTRMTTELAPGTYRVAITSSSSGSYRLALRFARAWPSPWGTVLSPIVATDASLRLAIQTDVSLLEATPTHVAIWVEGVGEIARLPWTAHVEHDWVRPAGLERVRYRARLMKGDQPLTGWSLPAESVAPAARRRAVRQ
ncbi:MAG TPA: putative metal-binding motif-containing protein [Thermoanaerobaculia bacterium]